MCLPYKYGLNPLLYNIVGSDYVIVFFVPNVRKNIPHPVLEREKMKRQCKCVNTNACTFLNKV